MLFSATAFAQDSNLLAYESSQKDTITTVDDDINAALAALNEVNAILDAKSPTDTGNDNIIDVEAIIAAANTPEPAKQETKPVIAADKAPNTQTAPDKAEKAQETAVKEVAPEPKPEPEKTAAAPVIAANNAPNVQTAPTKAEKAQETAAKEVAPEPKPEPEKAAAAPIIAANKAPNVQTAPTKAEKAQETTAKEVAPEPKPEPAKPVIAANKAPNVQTAPTKAEKAQETTEANTVKTEPKTEPAKPAPVVAANTVKPSEKPIIAPDGTHVTTKPQTTSPTPNPANAPHTLSMSYVMAIYQLNGVDLSSIKSPMPTIGELYQHAFTNKLVYQSTKPAIGDLAFFHNTVDRNRDGRWNDWHTLVGIVESIDNDETITILTYQTNKIERIKLNLKYPELQKGKKGQILNTQIRPNEGAQKGTTAKLFAGFANLLGNATSVTVIDNWSPGMKLTK